MDMPSSPPELPHDVFNDPPSSPPLPPVHFPTRKRHADEESSLSSDPVFSEDVSEESEHNGGKRQRHYYTGLGQPAVRRGIVPAVSHGTRNQDSGVWMGSDSSVSSVGSNASVGGRRLQALSFQDFKVKRAPLKTQATPQNKRPIAEQVAVETVTEALDTCKETVDLSNLRLHSLPNDVVRPLHQLIRHTLDINDPQKMTPDHFAPLTPEIKLFLSNNELTSLPSELWNLGNIAVLSLRNNQLTELSPFVARLRKLQELNLAGNQLQSLPWELLGLLRPHDRKLLRLSVSPNPLLHPLGKPPPLMLGRMRLPSSAQECLKAMRQLQARCPVASASDCSYEGLLIRLFRYRLHDCLAELDAVQTDAADVHSVTSSQSASDTCPMYVASSAAHFYDIDGSSLRSPISFSSSQPEHDYTASLAPQPLPTPHDSPAPSLFELSARACARSPFLGQLDSLLPDDPSPPVTKALERATRSKEEGLRTCSVCKKQYLIARAEWMEYWHNGSVSSNVFLPFLRQACSWACVGRLRVERDEEIAAQEGDMARAEYAAADLAM